jgi:hypothetical protein
MKTKTERRPRPAPGGDGFFRLAAAFEAFGHTVQSPLNADRVVSPGAEICMIEFDRLEEMAVKR